MAFQSRLRENTKEASEMQHLRKRKLPTLSMAPMIDCVFLLLLFFCDVVSQKNDLLTFCSWISAPPCALRRGRT